MDEITEEMRLQREVSDLRTRLRVEEIWVRHYLRRIGRLEERVGQLRLERDDLRRELDRRLVDDLR